MSGPWEKYQSAAPAAAGKPWEQYTAAAPETAPNPTDDMSTFDRLAASAGSGLASTVRALGGGKVLERFGLPGTREEAAALDRPLMDTTAGKVGKFVGQGAPALVATLVPGTQGLAGSILSGAITSAATTEGDLAERAVAAAGGAVGGGVGKIAGDALGKGAQWVATKAADKAAASRAANAGKDAALAAARSEGYVVTPSQADSAGVVGKVLQAIGGQAKTEMAASVKNQVVTNALARRALGLPKDAQIDATVLQQVRNQAGTAYDALRGTGTVQADQLYDQALSAIIQKYQGAAAGFPGLVKPEVEQVITTMRQPLFTADAAVDAIKVLRGNADDAFRAGNSALGKASREAADAMEAQLERHLVSTGQPADLLSRFQDARRLIAKTFSVEKALNGATGDVSAQKLAGQLAKGKPLSGELKSAAEFGQSFPKAAQSGVDVPPWSVLDVAMGSSGAATLHPGVAALFAARPLARSAVLNPTVQRLLVNPNREASAISQMAPKVLDSEPSRRLWKLLGTEAGAEALSNR